MATRAIISVNGKPFVATFEYGNPYDLGRQLAHTKNKSELLEVAKNYNIYAMDPKEEKLYGFTEEDDNIDISNLSDMMEFQYDLKNGKWYVCRLDETWQKVSNGNKVFVPLNEVILAMDKANAESNPNSPLFKGNEDMDEEEIVYHAIPDYRKDSSETPLYTNVNQKYIPVRHHKRKIK